MVKGKWWTRASEALKGRRISDCSQTWALGQYLTWDTLVIGRNISKIFSSFAEFALILPNTSGILSLKSFLLKNLGILPFYTLHSISLFPPSIFPLALSTTPPYISFPYLLVFTLFNSVLQSFKKASSHQILMGSLVSTHRIQHFSHFKNLSGVNRSAVGPCESLHTSELAYRKFWLLGSLYQFVQLLWVWVPMSASCLEDSEA